MMKKIIFSLAAALICLTHANAAIVIESQVEGWLGSDRAQVTTTPGGTTQVSFDATGLDKLVVVFAAESGFNNNTTTALTMSFNGVSMTQAIFQQSYPNPIANDNGAIAIFYLDNPFQGAANFSTTQTHTAGGSNGGHVSILGLTGTADGVGAVNGTSYTGGTAPWSTTLTTTGADSLVIAGFQNSGANNAGTTLATPTAGSGFTLSNNGNWNTNWAAAASAYRLVDTSGTNVTPAFEGGGSGTYRDVAAVEFLAIPEPSSLALVALGGLALLRRRR